MRFAVSLLGFRPGRIGGAETYLRELIAHLPAAAAGDSIVALLHPEAADALATPGLERAILPRSDRALVAARGLEALLRWRARDAEALVAGVRADAVLFPQQSMFPLRTPAPAVLTVHDVLHRTQPRHLGLAERAFRAAVYGASLRRATRVIAISEVTRRALVERCGVPPERIAVVHQGVRPPPATRPAPWTAAGGPYLYYPAATYAHKGHAQLFRSYATLRRTGRLDARLVLTGQRTPHWRDLEALARRLGIAGDVLHLGFLPAAEIERVYASARAVVFPSQHEGFGLPVLEAARLGVPMITSRLEIFEEVGVPDARRIDFADPEQLHAALERGGPLGLTRIPATWAEVARATLDALGQAARSTPRFRAPPRLP